MEVRKFVFNPFQENTYLIFDETKEAVIIDCGCSNSSEQQRLIDFIKENNLELVKSLNTHLHIDHIAGNSFIKDKFGLAPTANDGDLVIYEKTLEQAAMFGFPLNETPPAIGEVISEGDKITFGNETLEVLHVPGHSPGSLCFYSRESGIVFVGDVLFQRSIGRTDLWGGDTNTLLDGVKTKLFSLDDEVIVAPGHGTHTTIGEERQHNPFF